MATPNIGTTISEGYSRGLDRLGSWFPSLAVVAVAAGLIAGAIAQVQVALVPDAADALAAAFRGKEINFSPGDLRTIQLLSLLSSVVTLVLSYGAWVVFSGALHRERHGLPSDVPGPGAILPATLAGFSALMPRIALVFGPLLLGQLIATFVRGLGGIISLVGLVLFVYFSVRWIYTTVIAGSGEAVGDAAFDRSAATVGSSWWGTLGVFFVVGLATTLPVYLAGALVGGILPGVFLTSFGRAFVITMGGVLLSAATIESAWHQVEGAAPLGEDPGLNPAPPLPPAPERPGHNEDPRGPFI